MASSQAIERIKKDESAKGFMKKAEFIKTQGGGQETFRTIGWGFSLQDVKRSKEDLIMAGVRPQDLEDTMSGKIEIKEPVAEALFQMSLQRAEVDAQNAFSNYSSIPQNIKDVLVNMSFQLGATNLNKFVKMRKAVEDENWPEMIHEMLDSKWARTDSTSRANRLAAQVKEVEFTPIPAPIPQTALARQNFLRKAFEEQAEDKLAEELSAGMHEDFLVDELSGPLIDEIEGEPVTEAARPKLTKMEQGLFEDEAGKKFFVDADHRLLELDDNNQPSAVIDPSKFDLSKVNREPAQINPEEEIF